MTTVKIVRADGETEEMTLHSTSATGQIYQRIFNENFYKTVDRIRSAGEDTSIVQDVFPKVFYVWHLIAQIGNGLTIADTLRKTDADFIEWLMQYSLNAFISSEAVSAFAEEYSKGTETKSDAKN